MHAMRFVVGCLSTWETGIAAVVVATCGVGVSGTSAITVAGGNSVRICAGCRSNIQPNSKTTVTATMTILVLITQCLTRLTRDRHGGNLLQLFHRMGG